MRKRCYQRSARAYPDYGGRGIVMCDEWHESFEAFYRDMAPRPTGASIERIDNDGPYSPDNCAWASRIRQNNNKRSNHPVSFRGETRNISEWAREVGLPRLVILKRLKRGWPADRALTTPMQR